jgi:general secretion pathway protein L
MAETIIGLDIGTAGIKAVRLHRGLLGLEWEKAVQRDWPHLLGPFDLPPPDTQIAALREVWSEVADSSSVRGKAGRVRVVASVPTYFCSLRTVTLPFTDERRLDQVVPFEVEALLPYSLDDLVVDHQPLHTENGNARLLVAALPKDILRRYITFFSQIGIDPSQMDLDTLALYSLAYHGLQPISSETVMIEIGASKTGILLLGPAPSGVEVRFARTILHGSRQWTQALMEAHSISYEEAEQRKQQVGLSAIGGEDGTSRTLSIALEAWLEEVVKTLHVAQAESAASGGESPISSVVLCGGGAKLKGLDDFLARALGCEIQTLSPPLLREKGLAWDSALSQALGLALKVGGAKQASRLDFRKGEFAYSGEVVQTRKQTRLILVGVLILLMLAGLDLGLKYRLQAARYQALKGEVRQMFIEMSPETKTVVDEVQQARSAIAELKKKVALFGSEGPTALGVLAELTARIPKEIRIEVSELVIETERVQMEAETESFESVDRIKASVAQSPLFTEVEVGDAKITAGPPPTPGKTGGISEKKIRFRLSLKLAPSVSGGAMGSQETRS